MPDESRSSVESKLFSLSSSRVIILHSHCGVAACPYPYRSALLESGCRFYGAGMFLVLRISDMWLSYVCVHVSRVLIYQTIMDSSDSDLMVAAGRREIGPNKTSPADIDMIPALFRSNAALCEIDILSIKHIVAEAYTTWFSSYAHIRRPPLGSGSNAVCALF